MAQVTKIKRVLTSVVTLCITAAVALNAAPAAEQVTADSRAKCSVDTLGFAGEVVGVYRIGAPGETGESADTVRRMMHMEGVVPDSAVTVETDETQCIAAANVYGQHFRIDSLDRVVVVRFDSMRAIVRDIYAPPGSPLTTYVVIHLITNASFAVKDTLWY